MPTYALPLRGLDSVCAWLLGPGHECRGSRLILTEACGSPAFGQYRRAPGGHLAWALVVPELSDDGIAGWNRFLDTDTLFPRFGLPMELPPL